MSTDPVWDEVEPEYSGEEVCAEEGCDEPATTDRLIAVDADGDIVTELVCEAHELVYSYDEEWEEVGFLRGLWRLWRAYGFREVLAVFRGSYRA